MEHYFSQDFADGSVAQATEATEGTQATFGFGKVEAGCPADLVLMDYDPPTPLTAATLAGHLAYGLNARSVRSVVVNGNVRIKDRVAQFDNERMQALAREQARRLWDRMR